MLFALTLGDNSFATAGSRIWNSLHTELLLMDSYTCVSKNFWKDIILLGSGALWLVFSCRVSDDKHHKLKYMHLLVFLHLVLTAITLILQSNNTLINLYKCKTCNCIRGHEACRPPVGILGDMSPSPTHNRRPCNHNLMVDPRLLSQSFDYLQPTF